MSMLSSNQGELPSRLEKSQINELPLIRFYGSIQLASDNKSFKKFVTKLRKQKVLGFDIECKPSNEGPITRLPCFSLPLPTKPFFFVCIR